MNELIPDAERIAYCYRNADEARTFVIRDIKRNFPSSAGFFANICAYWVRQAHPELREEV